MDLATVFELAQLVQVSALRQLACKQMKCEHATLVASGRSLLEIDDSLQIGDVSGLTGVARCNIQMVVRFSAESRL